MEYQETRGIISDGASNGSSNLMPDNANPGVRMEIGRGGTEVTSVNGELHVKRDAPHEYNTGASLDVEGDLMSTARSSTGAPVVGRSVTAKDTIEYQGMRFSVEVALNMGLISRTAGMDANGNITTRFVATEEGDGGMPQTEAKGDTLELSDGTKIDTSSGGDFAADDETEGLMTQLVEAVSFDTQMSAMNSLMRDGEVSDAIISRIASQMGTEPEEAREMVTQLEEGMGASVMDHLSTLGIHNEDAFEAFVNGDAGLRTQFNEAVRNLLMTNSTAGFNGLAESFRERLAYHDPNGVIDALSESGIGWHYSDNGVMMVETPQMGAVSFETAVRAGLLRIS